MVPQLTDDYDVYRWPPEFIHPLDRTNEMRRIMCWKEQSRQGWLDRLRFLFGHRGRKRSPRIGWQADQVGIAWDSFPFLFGNQVHYAVVGSVIPFVGGQEALDPPSVGVFDASDRSTGMLFRASYKISTGLLIQVSSISSHRSWTTRLTFSPGCGKEATFTLPRGKGGL